MSAAARSLGVLLLAGVLAACRGDDGAAPTGIGGSGASTTSAGGGSGAAGGAGGAGALTEARMATWNLETYPLTASTAALVVEQIEQIAPDVVAIQEIADPLAFEELADALPDYAGLINDDPGAFLRVGMLYRLDRVTVSEVETLFPTDWFAFPRPPLKARLTLATEPAFDLLFVVVHLKAQLNQESQDRRRAACEALDLWVQSQLVDGSEPDIAIAGDFNDELTDQPSWNVFSVFLDAPESYSFLTMPLAQAGEHTYIPFESMIDHILVTSDALDEYGDGSTEILALEQTVTGYENQVSDHRPVLARFALGN